ncbi:MAG: lipase maturation factor family protein, partial [Polyangia bacterium]
MTAAVGPADATGAGARGSDSASDASGDSMHPGSVAGGGTMTAALFHRALAAIFLIAWLSLASQILLLVGSRGLLPLADFLSAARADNALSFPAFPSVLAWAPGDGTLLTGCLAGAALALLSLLGVRPRWCAALQTAWYLGYVTACRGFLGFQWDNLLLECGLLAAFLPTRRPAPLAHLLFRAVLFKLYFESGLAKWQSPLHDWQDGSAMTFYYPTAPLPTALAWYAHHLPRWWHLFESRATLVVELVVPFAIFGPRKARAGAAVLFTLFQLINAATANYGFFCYLSVALHLFLLDDGQLRAALNSARVKVSPALSWVRSRLWSRIRWSSGWSLWFARRKTPLTARRGTTAGVNRSSMHRLGTVAAWGGGLAWVFVSLLEAWFHFGEPGPLAGPLL